MNKVRMVCENCGSEDVYRDALTSWDIETQEWTIAGTLDSNGCNTCGEEDCIDGVAIQ